MLYCPNFRWTGLLAGNQIRVNLLLNPSAHVIYWPAFFWMKSWALLNNVCLIGHVLQLISVKSLGDCHLTLGGQGAGAGTEHLSQSLIRKHTYTCFAKGRGQRGGADTISAPEHYNCVSVNCCRKSPVSEIQWKQMVLFKGWNEGPSVFLYKLKTKAW